MSKKKKVTEEEVTEEAKENAPTVCEVPAKSKRDIIADTIIAGNATMESLMLAASCKYASVMSNFSMLRLMGKCPVKDVESIVQDEKGEDITILTYRLVDAEEWEKIKAEKAEKTLSTRATSAKTPEEQLEIVNKRFERLDKAVKASIDRANASKDSKILQLRAKKAALEVEIVTIEKAEIEAKIAG